MQNNIRENDLILLNYRGIIFHNFTIKIVVLNTVAQKKYFLRQLCNQVTVLVNFFRFKNERKCNLFYFNN